MNDETTTHDPLRRDCVELEEILSQYVLEEGCSPEERELKSEDRARIEEHLDGCDACREDLGALRLTAKLVRNLPPTAGALGADAIGVWREEPRLEDPRRARILSEAASTASESSAATRGKTVPGSARTGSLFLRVGSLAAAVVLLAVVGHQFWLRWERERSAHHELSLDSRALGDAADAIDPAVRTTYATHIAKLQASRWLVEKKAPGLDSSTGWRSSKSTAHDRAGSPPEGPDESAVARLAYEAAGKPQAIAAAQGWSLSATEAGTQQPAGDLALAPADVLVVDAVKNVKAQTYGVEIYDLPSRESRPGDVQAGDVQTGKTRAQDGDRATTRFELFRFAESGSTAKALTAPPRQSSNPSAPIRQSEPAPDDVAGPSPARAFATSALSAAKAPGGDLAPPEKEHVGDTPMPEPPAAGAERTATPASRPAGPSISDRVDAFLSRLDRRPGETPEMMFFRYWGDNSFVTTKSDARSTFGADVDTASYTLSRGYLYDRGQLPPAEALRTEEFVNYFRSHYAPPVKGQGAFAVHCEVAPSPYAHDSSYKLLKIGVKAREVPRSERKACSLVFVVDTSGSMRQGDRLETVKEALRLLVGELDEGDTIGIVSFDSTARVVLEPASAAEKVGILSAIGSLQPNHSTNVDAGLQLGYQMAGSAFRVKDSNRVILLSDGVANTGATDQARILENVRAEREKGIYLTTVGVGMGNHNDALLEQLADRGNGQCVYVDRLDEARKVFVDNLSGTLETIARDVKIQVEFEPDVVARYRQLGYENRAIADRDFRDNAVDAGEIGAGHEVTAIYEIQLAEGAETKTPGEPRTETEVGRAGASIGTVRVRYLTVEHGEAVELERQVTRSDHRATFAEASGHFQLSAHVAEFAEILRDSYWARGSRLAEVADATEALLAARAVEVTDEHTELVALMKRADALVEARRASTDEVALVVDALKENRYLRAQIESARAAERSETQRYLEQLREQNDDLRRRLERMLTP